MPVQCPSGMQEVSRTEAKDQPMTTQLARWPLPGGRGRGLAATQGTAGPRPGFTLIELLTVIAILALLVTILMPSLQRALAITRLTMCQANLSNQAKAHAVYGQDYDDRKPPIMWRTPWGAEWRWTGPDSKWAGQPVGEGILAAGGYLPFQSLLCTAAVMREDTAYDLENWKRRAYSGSSYEYYWRDPFPDADGRYDLSGEAVTYSYMVSADRTALAMDVNAEAPNAYYSAWGFSQSVESHPVMGRINVSYIAGNVGSYDNKELTLRSPGELDEQVLWWNEAHSRR